MKQDFYTIHEANFLSDLLAAMSDSDIAFISDMSKRILGKKDANEVNISRNIAKSAAALTATFPVLVTEATKLEHAMLVSKAVERKAVEMLRMLFAANQITSVTGAQAYLNRFHSNMDAGTDLSGMDVDDIIEYSNKIHESELPGWDPELSAITEQAKQAVIEDTKRNILHTLETENPSISLQEFKCRGNIENVSVWRETGEFDDKIENPTNILNEFQISSNNRTTITYDGDPNSIFTNRTISVQQTDPNSPENMKASYDALVKGVIPTDVKKANEASPSMVIINFVSTIPGGQNVVNVAVIGVKAVLHYVSSEDMVNRIVLKKFIDFYPSHYSRNCIF